MTELNAQTPPEIDAVLAELYYAESDLQGRLAQVYNEVVYYTTGRGSKDFNAENHRNNAIKKQDALEVQIDAVRSEAAPFEAEFTARGGWTRAFLVNNSNGHVHRNMHCSTCFTTTSYLWMTDYSGKDETEIVEAAGNRACTVCYPTAPVEVLNRPTQMFTKDEQEKAAARDARAEKKVVADAAKVYDTQTGKELYKTERAATNDVASNLSSMVHYGPTHPSFIEWETTVLRALNALAAKGTISDVNAYLQEALAKARRKCVADHKKFMRENGERMRGMIDPAAYEPDFDPVKF